MEHKSSHKSKKRKQPLSNPGDGEDDEEAVQSHLCELQKEIKKKKIDNNKVARLFSLTYTFRKGEMLSQPASTRINATLQNYPCLMKPICLAQEMYHFRGHRFADLENVRQMIRSIGTRWKNIIAPAIIQFAEESQLDNGPESDTLNDITMYCLMLLVNKLKSRKKLSVDPLDTILCFSPTLDEALRKNADNTYPYAICIGSASMFTSAVIVCNKKVITDEIGQLVFSILLTLIFTHYAFHLSYNPASQQVMEFLQEKVLGDRLPLSRKTTTAYSNLYRAVNCFEQRLEEEHLEVDDSTMDVEATQDFCDF